MGPDTQIGPVVLVAATVVIIFMAMAAPVLEASSASAPADRKKSVCADARETATQLVFLISNQEEKLLSMGDWMPCFYEREDGTKPELAWAYR